MKYLNRYNEHRFDSRIKEIVDTVNIELEDSKDFHVVDVSGLLHAGLILINIEQDFSGNEYFSKDIEYKTSLGGIDSEKLELNHKQYYDLLDLNKKIISNIAKKHDWDVREINTFKSFGKIITYFYIDGVLNESNDYVDYKYSQGELVELFKINLEDNNQFELLDVEDNNYFNIIHFASDTTVIKLTEDFSQNKEMRAIWEHTNDMKSATKELSLQKKLYFINCKTTDVIARKYDFIIEKVKLHYIDYAKFAVEFDIFIKQNK